MAIWKQQILGQGAKMQLHIASESGMRVSAIGIEHSNGSRGLIKTEQTTVWPSSKLSPCSIASAQTRVFKICSAAYISGSRIPGLALRSTIDLPARYP